VKASGVASDIALWLLHRPPAPRNVGKPEEAERPAPRRARMCLEDLRCEVKESRSEGVIGDLAEAILMMLLRDTLGDCWV